MSEHVKLSKQCVLKETFPVPKLIMLRNKEVIFSEIITLLNSYHNHRQLERC